MKSCGIVKFTSYVVAHRLAKEQRRNFGDDIAAALRMAKRKVRYKKYIFLLFHLYFGHLIAEVSVIRGEETRERIIVTSATKTVTDRT